MSGSPVSGSRQGRHRGSALWPSAFSTTVSRIGISSSLFRASSLYTATLGIDASLRRSQYRSSPSDPGPSQRSNSSEVRVWIHGARHGQGRTPRNPAAIAEAEPALRQQVLSAIGKAVARMSGARLVVHLLCDLGLVGRIPTVVRSRLPVLPSRGGNRLETDCGQPPAVRDSARSLGRYPCSTWSK